MTKNRAECRINSACMSYEYRLCSFLRLSERHNIIEELMQGLRDEELNYPLRDNSSEIWFVDKNGARADSLTLII